MYVDWALAPSGYYIAHAVVNNKHYYSSGRTTDQLEKNIKSNLYIKERISQAQVHLAQQKSETLEMKYASPKFMTRYVKPSHRKTDIIVTKTKIEPAPKPQYDHVTEIDSETGELVVFELREVARYKMKKALVAFKKKDEEPTLNTEEVDNA